MQKDKRSLLSAMGIYLKPVCIRMFFLGFSSGLPLLLILGTLSFWLREAGVDLKTIGFMSWIGLIYAFKWAWAPAVDRLTIPFAGRRLGRRRSWLLLSQTGLIISLAAMAMTDPKEHLALMGVFALCTAFCSATQDITLDAFRIESAQTRVQGALAAMYQSGYRLAMIWAGAGTLALAAFFSPDAGYSPQGWSRAYLVMAASIGVGMLAVLVSSEPQVEVDRDKKAHLFSNGIKNGLTKMVWEPLADFFKRHGRLGLGILCLIATYRIADIVMGVMANPFYADLGFTKVEVAMVTKVFGIAMTLLGAFVGGVVTMRIGVYRALLLGAILSAVTNVLFSCLSSIGHDVSFLIFTVSADNLAAGLATSAFVAYLSGLTNVAFSATQYALFSSLMLLLPKVLAGFSGASVQAIGYGNFFLCTAAMGIPVALLVLWLGKRMDKKKGSTR